MPSPWDLARACSGSSRTPGSSPRSSPMFSSPLRVTSGGGWTWPTGVCRRTSLHPCSGRSPSHPASGTVVGDGPRPSRYQLRSSRAWCRQRPGPSLVSRLLDVAAKGDQRVDQAIKAGATVAAILAAAQKNIIAAMTKTVMQVIARGGTGAAAAKRTLQQVIAARLGAASTQLKPVITAAAKAASDTGKPLPDAPQAIAKAILAAQKDAGEAYDAAIHAALGDQGGPLRTVPDAYRDAVEKAMRLRTNLGADVKALTGPERARLSLSQRQAAQKIIGDLSDRGLTGFTDSAGRNWGLDRYADMATRTASQRMHLSWQLSNMAQAGNNAWIGRAS